MTSLVLIFSPIFYHCLSALTNPAFCTDHSLSLEEPSHLHLQIIPEVFFSKESQSLSAWLLCLARVCVSLLALMLPMMADASLFLTIDYKILEGRDSSSPLFFQLPACHGMQETSNESVNEFNLSPDFQRSHLV